MSVRKFYGFYLERLFKEKSLSAFITEKAVQIITNSNHIAHTEPLL